VRLLVKRRQRGRGDASFETARPRHEGYEKEGGRDTGELLSPTASPAVPPRAPPPPTATGHPAAPTTEVEFIRTLPGIVAIADVALPDAPPVTVISVYGAKHEGYNLTTVHRILNDLTPLFDSRRYKRIVLGGDLNCSSQLPSPHGKRHRNLLKRIERSGSWTWWP